MSLLCIDFESYYDNEYSLTKMPTHQYVRDRRWQGKGCGFQRGLHGAPWYDHDPADFLASVDWDNTIGIAHNAGFDGTVLWEKYGYSPSFWIDTQLIARYLVGNGVLRPDQGVSLAKLAPLVGMQKGDTATALQAGSLGLAAYGVNDVEIEMALLRWYWSNERTRPPVDELIYMDMHVRMSTEPVLRLNKPLLVEASKETEQEKVLRKLLRQDKVFVQLLESLGVVVEYKTTEKGRVKPALAKTDEFMQKLEADPDERISQAASLRLGSMSNLVRTRAQRFLDIGEPMPLPQLYAAAHTLRSGGMDSINPQNISKKSVLREALETPEGYTFVGGDSRQIEARTVGWLAEDQNLLDTFATSDPYCTFAGRYMFGKEPHEVDDEERFMGKSGFLGCGFGQAALGLQGGILSKMKKFVELELCEKAVTAYRKGFYMVPKWWRRQFKQAIHDGYITLPSGRKQCYPDIYYEIDEEGRNQANFLRPMIFSKGRKGRRQPKKLWHGSVAENVTQGVARDLVFWQLSKMNQEGYPRWRASLNDNRLGIDGWKVILMEHDKGVFITPDACVEECKERLSYWLSQVPPWAEGLPVEGEVKVGKTFAEGA